MVQIKCKLEECDNQIDYMCGYTVPLCTQCLSYLTPWEKLKINSRLLDITYSIKKIKNARISNKDKLLNENNQLQILYKSELQTMLNRIKERR